MTWSQAQLWEVYQQTNGYCGRGCGKQHRLEDHGKKWHMGHIKARGLGGSDDSSNLEVECSKCNWSAGKDDGGYHYCEAIMANGEPCRVKLLDRRRRRCGRHR
jgi:hypothetical protein